MIYLLITRLFSPSKLFFLSLINLYNTQILLLHFYHFPSYSPFPATSLNSLFSLSSFLVPKYKNIKAVASRFLVLSTAAFYYDSTILIPYFYSISSIRSITTSHQSLSTLSVTYSPRRIPASFILFKAKVSL